MFMDDFEKELDRTETDLVRQVTICELVGIACLIALLAVAVMYLGYIAGGM